MTERIEIIAGAVSRGCPISLYTDLGTRATVVTIGGDGEESVVDTETRLKKGVFPLAKDMRIQID